MTYGKYLFISNLLGKNVAEELVRRAGVSISMADGMPFKETLPEYAYPASQPNKCIYCGQKVYMAYDHCTHCGAPVP